MSIPRRRLVAAIRVWLYRKAASYQRRWTTWRRRSETWTVLRSDSLPDSLVRNTIFLVGEDGVLWFAAFLCPCGCGDLVQLSLHRQGRPRWTVQVEATGLVSLSPSVWRQVGCRSHFSVVRGRLIWHRPQVS
jgi:hypothetical protein